MTFTIDATTAANIQALAEEWRVPKSEAIRRAVRQAREKQLLQTNERTPIDVLEHLERHPVLSVTQMRIRQASARRLRKDWKPRGTY